MKCGLLKESHLVDQVLEIIFGIILFAILSRGLVYIKKSLLEQEYQENEE